MGIISTTGIVAILIGGTWLDYSALTRVPTASKDAKEPQKTQINRIDLVPVEYKDIWYYANLPNTKKLDNLPEITGDKQADSYIRKIAQKRGYKQQAFVSGDLVKLESYEAQPKLADSWQKLKTEAKQQGIDLYITYGFRPYDEQRGIFLSRFNSAAKSQIGRTYSNQEIAEGKADEALNAALATAAIPGYSKHQTGYAIDIGQRGQSPFGGSPGFYWLSNNNYANAKKYGFIPSYPDGAGKQGPNPEPWEYLWIGKDNIREAYFRLYGVEETFN